MAIAMPLAAKTNPLGFDVITQYDGQEQVDLAVEIEIPGSWFGGGAQGSLTTAERREKYKAQAAQYAAVHEFPAAVRGGKKSKEKAIRFLCIDDAADDPHSQGYWMKLSQWNRYRHDTFKDRPNDELQYIKDVPVVKLLKEQPVENEPAKIKQIFELKGTGTHTQRDSTEVPCSFFVCKQPKCRLKGEPIKEIRAGTGQLFRHLKTCNNALWMQLRLESTHSKARRGTDGQIIEVSVAPCSFVCTRVLSHLLFARAGSRISHLTALRAPMLCGSCGRSTNHCPRTCALSSIASSIGRCSTRCGRHRSERGPLLSMSARACRIAPRASRSSR